MNVLRLKNPLTTEEGIRLDIFALGIMIMDMCGLTSELREQYECEQK